MRLWKNTLPALPYVLRGRWPPYARPVPQTPLPLTRSRTSFSLKLTIWLTHIVGAFGSKTAVTHQIDAIAKRGVLFKNAVLPGMMCGPSRNCLMTGLYPHNLGFYRNGQMKQLPEGVWTLPKALQRAGYYTAWIGKSHIRPFNAKANPQAMETEMGFDFVRKTLGRAMLGGGKGKGSTDWYYQHLQQQGLFETFKAEFPNPSTLPEDDYLDGLFTKTAIDFLSSYDKAEHQPFFLWLNYSLPHGPHDVSQSYLDRFSAADMPGSTKAQYKPPEKLVADTRLARSEEKTKETQAAYCGAVAFLDRQVEESSIHSSSKTCSTTPSLSSFPITES